MTEGGALPEANPSAAPRVLGAVRGNLPGPTLIGIGFIIICQINKLF